MTARCHILMRLSRGEMGTLTWARQFVKFHETPVRCSLDTKP